MVHLPAYTEDKELSAIQLIACDMDSTLLADDKTQPEGMPERIRALADAGVVFCPASGRPSPTLIGMFPEFADRMAFMADNGAAITYQGKLIYKDLIEPALYHQLIDATLKEGSGIPVLCCFDTAYVHSSGRPYHEALSVYYQSIHYVDSFEGVNPEANKYTIYFPHRNSHEAYDAVFSPAFGEELSVACAGIEWIDFMNKTTNKGAGLTHLCNLMGIDLAHAAAVGDTMNDREMLDVAGHSFLVANATEGMDAHANYVVPSNNDRGVAILIDAILAAH